MLRFLTGLIVAFLIALPARAEDYSPAVQSAVQEVIGHQLDAFAADNGATAYSFAAPIIKKIFPEPETFMAMVKQGYEPVYRNSSRTFGKLVTDSLGRPAQIVELTGLNGKRYEALYSMEQQPDGTWKIAGCTLREVPGVDA
jgi:Domain of unknown function (DUF4864)